MTDINKFLWRGIHWILLLACVGGLLFTASGPVLAQDTYIRWSEPINISNSKGYTSTDPFVLADPSGTAHLFWAEKVLNTEDTAADTLMYAFWDGEQWSKPNDIFFALPQEVNLIVSLPQAVMDNNGRIHLIWMGEPNAPNYALYYSSGPASEAGSARAWESRATLADDLTGSEYSIHIAYAPPTTLHVIFARVAAGDAPSEERAVSYMRSTDLGENWTDPVDLIVMPSLDRGASNTRLLVDPPDRVYACWTEWDSSGNGQVVYFDRSVDNGQTWDRPMALSTRIGIEYERDWCSLGLLGPGQIVAMWEGGYRAYRYGMYSDDGGVTWSDPIDTFPWLIGENGFVDFYADSAKSIHAFLSQRVREGNEQRGNHEGLYTSVWMGGTNWQEPVLAWGDIPMVNPSVAIVGGNRVVVAWYSYTDLEVRAMTGEIPSAPYIPPTVLSAPILPATATVQPAETATATLETSSLMNTAPTPASQESPAQNDLFDNPMLPVMLGIVFTILVLVLAIWIYKFALHK